MKSAVIKDVYLKTPDLSDEAISGFNVGVRPFRRSGVRIDKQSLQDKLIIHNYGYGGSGLTLCWGGAQKVSELVAEERLPATRIAIIGAGVAGLACAFELLKQGHAITIYADKFIPDITSSVAAGIFTFPVLQGTETPQQAALLTDLFEISTARYLSNLKTPEFAGMQILNDYIFNTKLIVITY